MAWNEGNGKNPWGNRPDQTPPDLDEVVKNLQKKVTSLFGGGRGGRPGSSKQGAAGLWFFALIGLVLWGLSGVYTVDAPERGVVLRFGEYSESTMPGLRWHMPWPIETVEKVNVAQVNRFDYKNQMLTADENIVYIEVQVQYRRADAQAYLFNVQFADETLKQVSESAIREVVGKSTAESILGLGRDAIVQDGKLLMQETLTQYKAGIEIQSVNLVKAQPPPEVQAAVDDATKAREDEQRLRLEAQAYANDILPKAEGEAAKRSEDAQAYKARVVNDAEGEASRFTQLLTEYEKAPEVTRERLYLESVESVYANSSKVLLDAEGSGNLIYLPVDKLIEQGARGGSRDSQSGAGPTGAQGAREDRDLSGRRTRESR